MATWVPTTLDLKGDGKNKKSSAYQNCCCNFLQPVVTSRPIDRMSRRKRRETKQQPSRARSGNQISCCLVSLHFLCRCATSCLRARYSSNFYRQNTFNFCHPFSSLAPTYHNITTSSTALRYDWKVTYSKNSEIATGLKPNF